MSQSSVPQNVLSGSLSRNDPLDEYTLLCETCGYVLEGLSHDGNCPECGTPIKESLPHLARPGSPWQQKPSFRSLIDTCREMLYRPGPLLERVRIDTRSSRSLERWIVLATAASTAVSPWLFHLTWMFFNPTRGRRTLLAEAGWATLFAVLGTLVVAILLTILTGIERMGIRAFGRVHKRRITGAISTTVCAHACLGWATASVLFWTPVIALIILDQDWLVFLVPIGLFLGLLHFEILVWMGVRRCRYANRVRPDTNPLPSPPLPSAP
jgi:hypothetical protein